MKRLLRWLISLPRERETSTAAASLSHPPLAHYGNAPAPEWLPDHQAQWNHFLRTGAGQVLMRRMQAVTSAVSERACADVFHTAHSAGVGHGWNEARQWLESLSATSVATNVGANRTTKTDNQASGRDALIEMYAP